MLSRNFCFSLFFSFILLSVAPLPSSTSHTEENKTSHSHNNGKYRRKRKIKKNDTLYIATIVAILVFIIIYIFYSKIKVEFNNNNNNQNANPLPVSNNNNNTTSSQTNTTQAEQLNNNNQNANPLPVKNNNSDKNNNNTSQPQENQNTSQNNELIQKILQYQKQSKNPGTNHSDGEKYTFQDSDGNKFEATVILADISQYELKADGACTIMAFEAGIITQQKIAPNKVYTNLIVSIGALYPSNKHTNVEDIINVSRYKKSVERIKIKAKLLDEKTFSRPGVSNQIEEDIKDIVANEKLPLSMVITKSPESIFLHINENESVILFDSHPRTEKGVSAINPDKKGLPKSHFICFEKLETAIQYLRILFPYTVYKEDLGVAAEARNMAQYDAFKLKDGTQPADLELDENNLNKLSQEFIEVAKGIKTIPVPY